MNRTLAHIINPVTKGVSADLDTALPITFATLEKAREMAESIVEVKLYTAQFAEDHEVIPEGFVSTPDLQRSSATEFDLQPPRKLPLIRDIFSRLHDAAPTTDYLIYSNVDIAVKPEFYVEVNHLIDWGHDAFAINRRNIPGHYTHPSEISDMLLEEGTEHPGHDCFVIKREVFEKFRMVDSILGIGLCFRPILLNCLVFAENFLEVTDRFLTFHIGEDEKWQDPKWHSYTNHNEEQICRLVREIEKVGPVPDHPFLWKFLGPYMKPNPLPEEGYQAKIALIDYKVVNDIIQLKIMVSNSSPVKWPASWRSHLQLGWKWQIREERSFSVSEGRQHIDQTISPGEKIELELKIPVHKVRLPKLLEVNMVQENFSWFSDKNSPALLLKISSDWRGKVKLGICS